MQIRDLQLYQVHHTRIVSCLVNRVYSRHQVEADLRLLPTVARTSYSNHDLQMEHFSKWKWWIFFWEIKYKNETSFCYSQKFFPWNWNLIRKTFCPPSFFHSFVSFTNSKVHAEIFHYSAIRADVINGIIQSEITENHGKRKVFYLQGKKRNFLPRLSGEELQILYLRTRKKIKANTRETYLECKIYKKSLLILI